LTKQRYTETKQRYAVFGLGLDLRFAQIKNYTSHRYQKCAKIIQYDECQTSGSECKNIFTIFALQELNSVNHLYVEESAPVYSADSYILEYEIECFMVSYVLEKDVSRELP